MIFLLYFKNTEPTVLHKTKNTPYLILYSPLYFIKN